jgi:hypothetical protein
MGRFTNKIVVITDGTSGIGLAAARQFIKVPRSSRSNGVELAKQFVSSGDQTHVVQDPRGRRPQYFLPQWFLSVSKF